MQLKIMADGGARSRESPISPVDDQRRKHSIEGNLNYVSVIQLDSIDCRRIGESIERLLYIASRSVENINDLC